MSVNFKRNSQVENILAEINDYAIALQNPNIEATLDRKKFYLLVKHMINPIPDNQKEFEWNGIKIKTF